MTAEAKVPNDAADWEAIDIFVFTNGQQFSPPRKYHLNAQEMNWWKAILGLLARSQYGPLHSSIDLYTVDGEKLQGPLQLSNGAAYVAVKPPDNFIDTGYSKYLLKASRSWEKRQTRKSNSIEIPQPDECNVITVLSNTSNSNKKLKEDIVACEIVYNKVVPDPKVIDRPEALLNVHEYPQRDSSIINKQTDKKRVSPVQRSSILRKSATIPSATRKDSGKSKDVPRNSKGSLKVNDKALVRNGGTVTKSKIPQNNTSRISAVKPEQVGSKSKSKEAPLVAHNSNVLELTSIVTTDKVEHERVREKNDSLLVSNVFKSTDSEIPSVVVPLSSSHITNVTNNKILNNITEEFNTNESKITTDVNENVQKGDLLQNTLASSSSEKKLSGQKILNLSQLQRVANVSFAEKPDKNYVVINNGDLVNLKLQIEVRNGHRIVNDTGTINQKTHTFTDIIKTEKGSQINLDSEMTVKNKSLQSIFISDVIETIGIHGTSRAVVIKCACRPQKNYSISKISTETSFNDDKMYVILLPTPGLDKNFERCQCVNNAVNIEESQVLVRNKSSIINPVKKTTSTISLEKLTSKTDLFKDSSLMPPGSDKNTCIPKIVERLKIESETKHRVSIIEQEIINSRYIEENSSKINFIGCGVNANNVKSLAKCREISAKATQTEICSLLLEARRHEDGRYSFHLPPLNVLRYYKL